MSSIRLSFPQGDDGSVCVHVKDAEGEPVDLSAFSEITFTIKRSQMDADADAVFQGTLTGGDITILSPTEDGIYQVTIPKAKSAEMMLGRPYYWTGKLTADTGAEGTPTYGRIFAESPILG
jgi:hypothetical protein